MAIVERTSRVQWEGDLSGGSGSFSTATSGALEDSPVTFAARVQDSGGKSSPEEMIASAHAACYAMALSNTLSEKGDSPERLTVDVVCAFDDEALKITTLGLDVTGEVPGVTPEHFEEAAREAEQMCPVSNAFRGNVDINLSAHLGGHGAPGYPEVENASEEEEKGLMDRIKDRLRGQ